MFTQLEAGMDAASKHVTHTLETVIRKLSMIICHTPLTIE